MQPSLCTRSILRASALATTLLLSACAAVPRPVPQSSSPALSSAAAVLSPQPLDLRSREQLPEAVRDALAARMMRHGDEMSALTVAVLMLEYDLAHTLAADMAQEPRLGRPAPGELGTLNAQLPAAFFVQQDALVASAQALSTAAAAQDDKRVVDSFGALARACVGCHAAYLNEDLSSARDRDEALKRTEPCNPVEECGERE